MKLRKYSFCYLFMLAIFILSCSNDTEEIIAPPTATNPPPTPIDPPPIGSSGLTLKLSRNFGDGGDEFALGTVNVPDGGFVFCGGRDSEARLLRVDQDLNQMWELAPGIEGISGLENVIRTTDGNFVAVGFTQTVTPGIVLDLYLVKVDMQGTIIWEQTYGQDSILDTTINLLETSEGNILVVGSRPVGTGVFDSGGQEITQEDITVVLVDSDGTLIWNNTYGGSLTDTATGAIQTNDGNYLILGNTISTDGDVIGNEEGQSNVWVFQIGVDGEFINQNIYGGAGFDSGRYITALANGNSIITAINAASDAWIFTIDTALNIITQTTLGGSEFDSINELLETSEGNFIAVGTSDSADGDITENKRRSDYWVLKLSPSLLGGSGSDFGSGINAFDENKFFVVGFSDSSDGDIIENNGGFDIWGAIIEDIQEN